MLAERSDGAIAFEVVMYSNVMYVDVIATKERRGAGEAIMAVLEAGATSNLASEAQKVTMLHFHQRFENLALDAIVCMAQNPASRIRLTSNKRMACVS